MEGATVSMNPVQLQSYIAGRFVGARAGAALASAVDGRVVAHAHADELDFGEAVDHARRVGLPGDLLMVSVAPDIFAFFVTPRLTCRRRSFGQ